MTDHVLFTRVTEAFVAAVRGIRHDQWSDPGLDVWDVRALVGHTSRALITVIDYLALDEPSVTTIANAEGYYGIYAAVADNAAIAVRGVDAGAALGADPAATVAGLAVRAASALAAQPRGRLVLVRGGSMSLEEYLRTRVFELVVHTLDISRATGVDAPIPLDAMLATLQLATSIAAGSGRGAELLLALTGRAPLPEGFTVV